MRADRFLDGRIGAQQSEMGFRSGTDAVLLAAAVPARRGESLLEMGSGAGVASLCLAFRVPGCRILGIDISAPLVELAEQNARRNGLDARLSFLCCDALDLPHACRRGFHHVFVNPPFHESAGRGCSNRERARALQDEGRLGEWLVGAFKRVSAGGTLSAIIRADRLDEAIRAIPSRGMTVFPLWPRRGEAAKRIIVQVRKNSRAPLALHAGLILHEKAGHYTREAEEILRGRASLALGTPRR